MKYKGRRVFFLLSRYSDLKKHNQTLQMKYNQMLEKMFVEPEIQGKSKGVGKRCSNSVNSLDVFKNFRNKSSTRNNNSDHCITHDKPRIREINRKIPVRKFQQIRDTSHSGFKRLTRFQSGNGSTTSSNDSEGSSPSSSSSSVSSSGSDL